MLDWDWRNMLLAAVVLADMVVFADLVRSELQETRRSHRRLRIAGFFGRQQSTVIPVTSD